LHVAAWHRQLDIMKLLLENKAEVNAEEANGLTPLQLASQFGYNDEVTAFLRQHGGQDLPGDIRDAVCYGSVEKVKTLLKVHPELVHSKGFDGLTPLHETAMQGRDEMAALLLANNADVNAKDNHGETPLDLALSHKDMFPKEVELLLAHNAEINIFEASEMGNLEKAKALLKDHPNLVTNRDWVGQTALHFAAIAGQKEMVEFLLANKADINAKDLADWTPLYDALRYNNYGVAELLVANKAECNMLEAAAMGEVEKAKALLEDNPESVSDRDDAGRTPLHWAALRGYREVVELLLANKADVNANENDLSTALHEAAAGGFRDVAELLLSKKADANAKDWLGKTPLMRAEAAGRKDVVELLRQHGGHE
jgi:ankyrin repeat protein